MSRNLKIDSEFKFGNIDSGDSNSPYNFHQWKARNSSVKPNEEIYYYNLYITNWYKQKKQYQRIEYANRLKTEYSNFLKQLATAFATEEEKNYLNSISFDEQFDLSIAIPYYAKKLKELALYYAEKREEVRYSKLKHSLKGTSKGLQKIFYNHILNAFTNKRNNLLDNSFKSIAPELSAINAELKIDVIDLYDDSEQYYDKAVATTNSSDFSNFNSTLTNNEINKLSSFGIYSVDSVDSDISEKTLGLNYEKILFNYYDLKDYTFSTTLESEKFYWSLLNRNFPTIATIPNLINLKTEEDIGGFLIPKYLGLTQYVDFFYDIGIDFESIDFDTESVLTSLSIYDHSIHDQQFVGIGNYNNLTLNPIKFYSNLYWFKYHFTTNYIHTGIQKNIIQHQKFDGYSSKEESVKTSVQGVSRFSDLIDFWIGSEADLWAESDIFPLDERYNFDLAERQRKLIMTDKKLYNWSCDIYGNEYAIYKDYESTDTVFDKKYNKTGEVWIRDVFGKVDTLPNLLTKIIDKHSSTTYYSQLQQNIIKNFSVVKDVIIIELEDIILVENINFDFDTGEIVNSSKENLVLSFDEFEKYGEYWYDEVDNNLMFGWVLSSYDFSLNGSRFIPKFVKMDLTTAYIERSSETFSNENGFTLSAINIDDYDPPVLTKNKDSNQYTMGFITRKLQDIFLVVYNFIVK